MWMYEIMNIECMKNAKSVGNKNYILSTYFTENFNHQMGIHLAALTNIFASFHENWNIYALSCIRLLLALSYCLKNNQDPDCLNYYTDATMDTSEPVMQLPKPATLQDQFSNRSVYVMCNSDVDKLSSYWLSNLMADDSNVDETDERYVSKLVLVLRDVSVWVQFNICSFEINLTI